MLKSLLLSLTLATITLSCSSCATILGGIIGHQSGELCAGLAIGAAVDFSGDIARGIGQMTADDKDLMRDFKEKSSVNAPEGRITLPICPFNLNRTMTIAGRLQDKFKENGWTFHLTEKTTQDDWFSPRRWEEKWACTTDQQQPFEFRIDFCSSRDTEFRIQSPSICPPEESSGEGESQTTDPKLSEEQIAAITGRIYQWIEEIVQSGI
jgi:hypothetical protein